MEVTICQAPLLPSCMLNALQLNLLSNPVQLFMWTQLCSLAVNLFSLSGNMQKCSWEDASICRIITSFSLHVCFESTKLSIHCTQHKICLSSSPLSKGGIAGNVNAGLQLRKTAQLHRRLPERPNGSPQDQTSTDRKHFKTRRRLGECAKAQVQCCGLLVRSVQLAHCPGWSKEA